MRTRITFVIFLFICSLCKANDIEQIGTIEQPVWNIKTKNAVYQLQLSKDGVLCPTFWGAKAQIEVTRKEDRTQHNGPFRISEIPVRGHHADKIPLVEIIYADNVRDCELQFVEANIKTIDGFQTLEIVQKDKFYPLEIKSFIRVLPQYDLIEKWIEIKNVSKKASENILIENLLSGSIHLSPDRYFLHHHSGQWVREFQLRKTELTTGTKSLQSKDFYAFQNSPWFAVTNKPEDDANAAEIWFGQVHYSGNWRLDFEMVHSNHLQIVGGINFWDTNLNLKAGKTFTTPKMSLGYTQKGTEEASRLMHSYIREQILPKPLREEIRPVIYNSWYATTFDVNEVHQFELAKRAKEIGVELFVIDDGWFKGRKTDHAGLGDWEVDLDKFPNGLNPLIEKINSLGLDFGIWVEPEMVNPDSELYRKHPDWVLSFPNRDKTEWRQQLTLNLAREDVYQYLLESLTNLLENHNIKFIKWDRNRGLTQPGWASAPKEEQRAVRIKYIENLYRLIDTLKAKYPNVIFENCSSGAGRPDLGMLERMDQTWTSDNTDAIDRLFIQYGYLSAYPANTMVCWTNKSDAHRAGLTLDFTFDVAMQGVLGIGQNITDWDDEQMAIATRKVAEYKTLRDLIQRGEVYRLKSPFEGDKVAIQYVDKNKKDAVVLCYNLGEGMNGSTEEYQVSKMLRLQNLDEKQSYQIGGSEDVYSGKYLMDIGIKWPVSGAYKSKIVKINAVK